MFMANNKYERCLMAKKLPEQQSFLDEYKKIEPVSTGIKSKAKQSSPRILPPKNSTSSKVEKTNEVAEKTSVKKNSKQTKTQNIKKETFTEKQNNKTEELKAAKKQSIKKEKKLKVAQTKKEKAVAIPEANKLAATQPQLNEKPCTAKIKKILGFKIKKDKVEKMGEDGTLLYDLPKEKKQIALKNKTKNKVIERLETDPKTGLTKEQVESQRVKGLSNIVRSTNAKTYKSIFFSNIFTFFNLLCFVVAGALIAVGSYSNLFFVIVFLSNIVIGIVQEIRAKLTIEKISLISAPSATLLRNKKLITVPVEQVVLDDIIYFELGDQICADSIILSGAVEVNESLLTGESVPIKKKKGDTLFSGSFITGGKCSALVDKVGDENYSAKLAQKAKEYKKPKSELLKTLKIVIGAIGVVIIPLAVLSYINNYKLAILEFTTDKAAAIADAVTKTAGSVIGMIPAGMFLLTSVALAVGVIKLAKRKTLVQDLYSIEMLARADVLCLDKTGTITDGTMKIKEIVNFTNPQTYSTKEIIGSILAALEDNNMTSRALANGFGRNSVLSPVTLMPFTSTNKLSGVTFKEGTYLMGAPEYVYKSKNSTLDERIKKYAKNGYRVLLLVYSKDKIINDTVPTDTYPVSLIVIEDHIREDAIETIKWFNDNGVEIKIISGDNPITVSEVSKRVGIENSDRYISLEGLSDEEVRAAAKKYSVFGRVSPEQKYIIIKALKSQGKKVAMTGDGVNDILALKEADCSIAMASGSEAARNVSNLVLLDSNFSSLPMVVAEGRRVVNNISKSSSLFLMKTFTTIFVTIFCLITQMKYAFSPNQILLMETFVIGIPAFFLSLQTNKEKIRGSFMSNLISKALPGAFVLSLNVIACYVFDYFVPTGGQVTTMASLVMLFSGLVILLKVCLPFDFYKGVLYCAMVVLSLVSLFVLPDTFFTYVELSLQSKLFMIILIIITYQLYSIFVKVLDFIWDFQRNLIEITRNEARTQPIIKSESEILKPVLKAKEMPKLTRKDESSKDISKTN